MTAELVRLFQLRLVTMSDVTCCGFVGRRNSLWWLDATERSRYRKAVELVLYDNFLTYFFLSFFNVVCDFCYVSIYSIKLNEILIMVRRKCGDNE